MTSWHDFFIGLFIGLGVAAIVWIIYIFKVRSTRKKGESEVKKYKEMLTSRMEIESEGVEKLKKSNEELKSQNENLRISLQTMSQKEKKSKGFRSIRRLLTVLPSTPQASVLPGRQR